MPAIPFAGSWKLISSEMRTSSGDVHFPLGADCVGRLMVDDEGNFSVQLMQPGRPEFSSGDILRGTEEEIRAAYQGYVGFWANIDVDPKERTISYQVEGSLFPNWIGQDNLRYYELEGDRLILKTPAFLMAEQQVTGVLTWQRISASRPDAAEA